MSVSSNPYTFPGESFSSRHIGPGPEDQAKMLTHLGYSSLEELVEAAVPASIRTTSQSGLASPVSEATAAAELAALAGSNTVSVSMIGLGYYPAITPAVIRRNVLEDPAWYTAYTPYQPEISQGRLEALLNFQTMVSDLTALPVANASLLDEATAVVEAILLMRRASKSKCPRVLVDQDTLPQTVRVLHTRAESLGLDIHLVDLDAPLPADEFCALVASYPGRSGEVRDLVPAVAAAHERGALVTVITDLLALTLLRPPGEFEADIAVGSSQRFGVPLFFGGPHAAFMSVRAGLERQLPGRLVGVSVDSSGQSAYRLALQTREQHIRRDKATSNICTAQVLLAVVASMYAVYHGPQGLTDIARRIHTHTELLASRLSAAGHDVLNRHYFDTLTVRVPGRAAHVEQAARREGLRLGMIDADHLTIACSEITTDQHVQRVIAAFTGAAPTGWTASDAVTGALPTQMLRTSRFLTHPVFHDHRSETAMLRYLRRLAGRDFALDRGMIPLGSCTMKLNATSELEPITLPGFADVHPFAPAADVPGYITLTQQLEAWLADLTGYAAVSLQPNAGSQGELAGLLAIRAYHRDHGETQRTVCLIPSSAHGTNAASAVLAGMRVVVVASHDDGSIDMADLEAKCVEQADELAAVMVTYPSTHGVYEENITRLCDLVHAHGGQVYIDGANLNALLGIAKLGEFGGDVSHLNLHKTFCIPHGGGGPGVGPIAVAQHLVRYLPTHHLHPDTDRREGTGPVSAAPYGSAGILPISWAYIRMLGTAGLTEATSVAVLNANYLAARLDPYFPVLYRGANGLVAHECIIDLRDVTAATGVTVDDVAKRLVDFGFHAPTMSFPVPGTLMIEPTESENTAELDRFVDAMAAIRREIDEVDSGQWPVTQSPLRLAPHTAAALTKEWDRDYSRSRAVFPAGVTPDKYWPPVGRIEQAHGDRNLLCTCPDPTAFEN